MHARALLGVTRTSEDTGRTCFAAGTSSCHVRGFQGWGAGGPGLHRPICPASLQSHGSPSLFLQRTACSIHVSSQVALTHSWEWKVMGIEFLPSTPQYTPKGGLTPKLFGCFGSTGKEGHVLEVTWFSFFISPPVLAGKR